MFVSDRNRNYDVWELDLTTNQTRSLTTNPGTESGPTYSPDGTRIAYASDRPEAPGLCVFEGSSERLVWASAAPLGSPAWSVDGQTVFFQLSTKGQTQLVAKSLATDSTPRILSSLDEDVLSFRPGFDPDGRLLYVADGAIKLLRIGVENAIPETVPLSATVSLSRNPYVRKSYDFDSQKPRPVKGLRGPAVSPDGTRIAFAALGDLYLLTVGNPRPEALTHDAFVEANPAWSPDGNFLAYVSDRSGVTNLWLRDLATGQDRPSPTCPTRCISPPFRPMASASPFTPPNHAMPGDAARAGPAGERRPALSNPKKSPRILVRAGLTELVAGREIPRGGVAGRVFEPLLGRAERVFTYPRRRQRHRAAPQTRRGPEFRISGRNGPAWCPDGTQVAYVMDGLLWTLPVTPEGRKAGPPRQRTSTLADNLSWTSDGKTLFFSAIDTLKRLDLTTGRVEVVPLDFPYQPEIPTQTLVIHAGKVFDGKLTATAKTWIFWSKTTASGPSNPTGPDDRAACSTLPA